MRNSTTTILAIEAMLDASPTQAQTYDPSFRICLQTFGRSGNYIDCHYSSMAQCQLSAWGIAAQCITNPYFAPVSAGKTYGRHHRHN
jgi:hypothetical protein